MSRVAVTDLTKGTDNPMSKVFNGRVINNYVNYRKALPNEL
jgi:hypothetical protein